MGTGEAPAISVYPATLSKPPSAYEEDTSEEDNYEEYPQVYQAESSRADKAYHHSDKGGLETDVITEDCRQARADNKSKCEFCT